MKIPYTELELRLALIKLSDREKELVPIMEELNKLVDEKEKPAKRIADFHGIEVDQLINSPNYSVLQKEYQANILQKSVDFLMDKGGLTHKEAWALISVGLDLIE